MRTGIAWFILAVPAVWYGKVSTAALFGLVALVAALQAGQAWNKAGYRTSRLVAACAAVAVPAAALLPRPATAGIVVAVVPFFALLAAMLAPVRRRRVSAIAAAGATVCSCLPGAIAAAGMVAVSDLGRPTALTLLALVSAYEVGSFLFGAESPYPSHAILVGGICTMAIVAPIWVFRLQPFDGSIDVWIFGGMVAVFAPLGSIVASAALPTASTWVPALRRLDAYIVAAPLWASAMWAYLAA